MLVLVLILFGLAWWHTESLTIEAPTVITEATTALRDTLQIFGNVSVSNVSAIFSENVTSAVLVFNNGTKTTLAAVNATTAEFHNGLSMLRGAMWKLQNYTENYKGR
ncbi:unnamed protein product [Vitrella brassicaformis CCMP3155]|uniref:FAS1 domain-containing protein n=1 Tax=Vitrella brassicaformis (strain CCMP3155) TaxID=1169540 RepID=A0A0G4H431_VITBC|nr:unnamed protein product [Vitrella brassicaformis CCMP3155]|mmetsp:Transcript_44436/g.110630  ORF Transcript_44436/g.110630 Transcript_44436/m.110630 type:complete len:107 (-) Transcript_44436:964-1284(-)|eukprot:CEM38330.1 unnamed protein product [Vitrella brassicaformis CCMP3155]